MAIQATAYQEAGHALAAIYLDQAFSEVNIVGNEKVAGYSSMKTRTRKFLKNGSLAIVMMLASFSGLNVL